KHDPVNARVIIQKNQFALSPASSGYELDVGMAATAFGRAVTRGETTINLPVHSVPATVTDTSLTARLHDLNGELATNLAYTYGNSTSKPTPATILSWYTPSGNDYTLADSAI